MTEIFTIEIEVDERLSDNERFLIHSYLKKTGEGLALLKKYNPKDTDVPMGCGSEEA
jgi:hypothetical protein